MVVVVVVVMACLWILWWPCVKVRHLLSGGGCDGMSWWWCVLVVCHLAQVGGDLALLLIGGGGGHWWLEATLLSCSSRRRPCSLAHWRRWRPSLVWWWPVAILLMSEATKLSHERQSRANTANFPHMNFVCMLWQRHRSPMPESQLDVQLCMLKGSSRGPKRNR